MLFRDGWCKTEGISLFGEGYRIIVLFLITSKEEHLSGEQKKVYNEFWVMYVSCCAELENLLEGKEYADIFEPDEVIFRKNGDYKMPASDTTSDDSNFKFVTTFNPIGITLQEIDY